MNNARGLIKRLPWRYLPLIWPLEVWVGIVRKIWGESAGLGVISYVIEAIYKWPKSPPGWLEFLYLVVIFFGTPSIFLWGVIYSIYKKYWWMLVAYLVVAGGPIALYVLAPYIS